MIDSNSNSDIQQHLSTLCSQIDTKSDSLAIILAAGHGKRIKSERSKMLHEIWGKPTVVRVADAAQKGLATKNQIVVVGIKARDVADALGKLDNRLFVFQAEQHGTGDAVRIALEVSPNSGYSGDIFIFPGDMGLLTAEAVSKFKHDFSDTSCDMMVLTGVFEGDPNDNYYGRILRVPDKDIDGEDSGDDEGKVIEIKEHKDILTLKESETYEVNYKGRTYGFSKKDLVDVCEFNTGVFAFKANRLGEHVEKLKTDNVQGELYLTDLIAVFNQNDLTVKASPASDNRTVLGFNVKSVLKEMGKYARQGVYDILKDIITIEDQDDFFIADELVEKITELDKKKAPLDIYIGKSVHLGPQVQLSKGVRIDHHARVYGKVLLSEDVHIHGNVFLSTYPGQTLRIGTNSEVFQGNIIKGNLEIGENCRIESSVNMTGSDEFPVRIGNNVTIKGTSYVFGCLVDDGLWIEHSVLKHGHLKKTLTKDGSVQKVRYVLPTAEGLDSIADLRKTKHEVSAPQL